MTGAWRAAAIVALTMFAGQACTDAADIRVLEVEALGAVRGLAYLDANGSGALDAADLPLESTAILVSGAGGGAEVARATTDALGLFAVGELPVGSYVISVDPTVFGDSLEAVQETPSFSIALGDTAQANLGVSFPTMTVEEVRAAAPGRRVFTTGLVLNAREPFGDGQVHIMGASEFLRAVNLKRVTLTPGDSVRLSGRTGIDNGQPVLEGDTAFVLIPRASLPLPLDLSTGLAASAQGGQSDAALVRVRTAEIIDTATVAGSFQMQVNDGSGPIDVVLRSFLYPSVTGVGPDSILRIDEVSGLLTPIDAGGSVRWQLLPRGIPGGIADLQLEVREADLGLSSRFDTAQVVTGDSVQLRIVASNAGPLAANGVTVTDTLPTTFTFLQWSSSRGMYDVVTSEWALDTLGVGQADTLWIEAVYNATLTGSVTNVARLGALVTERDPNIANNSSSAGIGVGARLADLVVASSFDTAQASLGDTLQLTVLAVNAGPRSASNVVVADTLGSDFLYLGSSTSRGTFNAATGLWDVGSLSIGVPADTLSITVEVATAALGLRTNLARIGGPTLEIDPAPGNNSAASSVTLGSRRADLSVAAVFDAAQASVGDTVTVTITASNNGPKSAADVVVADTIPSAFTLLSSSASRGLYDSGTGLWTLGTVDAEAAPDTLTLTLEVATAALGTVTNTVRIGGPTLEVDPVSGNNTSVPSLTLVAP